MPKYIVRLDRLTAEWHVFRIDEEKEDFIQSYGNDIAHAIDYCDQQNCTCYEHAGDNPQCPVHGR